MPRCHLFSHAFNCPLDVTVSEEDDVSAELFVPLKRLLDQSKSAKVFSRSVIRLCSHARVISVSLPSFRKLTKRLEDLLLESSALKSTLVSQLKSLTNRVPELVNFGIQVCDICIMEWLQVMFGTFQLAQTVMPRLSDIRNNKSTLQSKAILTIVKQIAGSTVAKEANGDASWENVSDAVSDLIVEAGAVVPLALEAESVIKSTRVRSWAADSKLTECSLSHTALGTPH